VFLHNPLIRLCAFTLWRIRAARRDHHSMNRLITEDERSGCWPTAKARAAGQAIDPLPVVRLFTPDAHVTWLLAALDPADGDTAYGLIDLGIGMPALGTSSCPIWPSIVGPRKQPVMRDLYFQPTRTLSEYTRLARRRRDPGLKPFGRPGAPTVTISV
jgi:hypothetical protein